MEIFGRLNDYFETGTEGTDWAIEQFPSGFVKRASYDDLFLLEEGDYLVVYDPKPFYENGERIILWSGVIKRDKVTNLTETTSNPLRKQQVVNNRWVHWLQEGFFDHEQWFWLFTLGYPAKLVRSNPEREEEIEEALQELVDQAQEFNMGY